MHLTTQQQQQLASGLPVELDVDGEECVLLTRQAFNRVAALSYDASPWSDEEIELLAAEAAELVAGDGLDREDRP